MHQNSSTKFVDSSNIARFRALLQSETDPDRREILLELLALEEARHLEQMIPLGTA